MAPHRGQTSLAVSVTTLLKNIMGAGIMSLPLGLLKATPLPGIGILAMIGVLSAGSYWMIGYCCLTWGVGSFRELWSCVLGRDSAWMIDIILFFNGWFTLVCYVVLIGDFTTKSFAGLLGEDHLLARSRLLDQWFIALAVLLPLSLAKDLSKLAFTSLLGLVVLLYVLLLVIRDSVLYAPKQWSPDMVLSEWRMGAFEAIVLYTHAFVAHFNGPKLFSELARPTHWRWLVVVVSAYTIVLVVYASFALAGLRRFEGAVEGNLLRNYGPRLEFLVAWLGMGFSIAFTYPLVFNSMREAAVNLYVGFKQTARAQGTKLVSSPRFNRTAPRLCRRTSSLVNLLGPSPEQENDKLVHTPGTRATVLLVLLTVLVGTRCEDVGLVNALAGSITGVMLCLVLPALLL